MARIVHIFTFRAFPTVPDGVPLTEAYDFGRFTPHLVNRPGDALRITNLGQHREVLVTSRQSTLAPLDMTARLWSDEASLAQLHLSYELDDPSPHEVANHLAIFCHERTSLSFDGVALVDWLVGKAGLDRAPRLDQDVLQFVELDDAAGLATDMGEPSKDAVAMIYRTAERLPDGGVPAHMPAALNSLAGAFAGHGRGVVVLGGQSGATAMTVRLTACELLFAVGRARHARAKIENLLQGSRTRDEAAGIWDDAERLSEVAREVRRQRTIMALDVQGYADGLFMPELVIDSFRTSFAEALRLGELTDSTVGLMDALSDVIGSSLADIQLRAAKLADTRERRWQLGVGMASGIAIPVALLLSYFGVSSEATIPAERSIYDLTVYGLVWALAVASAGAIAAMTLRQYFRTKNGDSTTWR
ncbi:hypothetical protein ACFS27_19160 [Promicromonospora vindobonensis]|uniref:Uncharacterized protein n=1 Tax=Promicromonospora vindobonensis TaxID=195748 RepID=A0ABW5VVL8_9MICO